MKARAGFLGPLEVWAVDTMACRAALLDAERQSPRLPDDAAWQSESERMVAHIALRILLERATGLDLRRRPFEVTRSGKPSLAGSPVCFSLSHCPGLALIAIDVTGPVGADVERIDRRIGPLTSRRERMEAMATLLAGGRPLKLAGDAAAIQSWVRLEAFAKADGAGIAVLLSRLGIIGKRLSDDEAAVRAAALVLGHRDVGVDDLEVEAGFVAALARPASRSTPTVRPFPQTAPELHALVRLPPG